MAKAKTTRRRSAKSEGDEKEVDLVALPEGTSPAAANALNIRLNGGVVELPSPESEDAAKYRASANDPVEIPRLDVTVVDPVFGRIYPSSKPVTVSYGLAVTLGLLNANPNNPPAAIRQQSLITEPQTEGGTAAEDNGHGGTGRESGYEQPAPDLTHQPVTIDEMDAAAAAAGNDEEGAAARRQAEIDARREALRP